MVLQKRPTEELEKEEVKKEEPKEKSAIEEAKEVNVRKAELLEREEALQKRKEDFEAERMVGGRADAGEESQKTNEEKLEEETNAFLEEEK